MGQETHVVPGIRLVRVETDGTTVTADLFGGENPVVMGEVHFPVHDPMEHAQVVRTFTEWERHARPVTLIQGRDGVITLLDEATTFRSAGGW